MKPEGCCELLGRSCGFFVGGPPMGNFAQWIASTVCNVECTYEGRTGACRGRVAMPFDQSSWLSNRSWYFNGDQTMREVSSQGDFCDLVVQSPTWAARHLEAMPSGLPNDPCVPPPRSGLDLPPAVTCACAPKSPTGEPNCVVEPRLWWVPGYEVVEPQ